MPGASSLVRGRRRSIAPLPVGEGSSAPIRGQPAMAIQGPYKPDTAPPSTMGPRHHATPLYGHATPHHAGPATRATTPYPTPHTPHAEGREGRTAPPHGTGPIQHPAPYGHRTPQISVFDSGGTRVRPRPQKRKEGPLKRHDGARCAGPLPAAMHHTPCRYTPPGVLFA